VLSLESPNLLFQENILIYFLITPWHFWLCSKLDFICKTFMPISPQHYFYWLW